MLPAESDPLKGAKLDFLDDQSIDYDFPEVLSKINRNELK